jgi:putative ABC transport system substrate-binding protein
MGLRVQILNVGTGREINSAFATFERERPDALFVSPDPYFVVRRVQIVTLAARHAIPTSFSVREPVEAGGLMSYGTDLADVYRQAGVYTGRILKGAKPADLPIVQTTKFELTRKRHSCSALPCHPHCSRPLTRSSNEKARVHHAHRRRVSVAARGKCAGSKRRAARRHFEP